MGRALLSDWDAEGAKVIVDYVGDPAGAEETRSAIEAIGRRCGEIVQADVTTLDDVRKLVDTAWKRFGSADILVNNAGMEHKVRFLGHDRRANTTK